MLAQEPLGKSFEVLACLGKDKRAGCVRPFQFEAGGKGRDPYLSDWSVGCKYELAVIMLEDNVEDAVLFFGFKGNLVRLALFFGPDEGLFQSIEGLVGFAAEGGFIEHRNSVAGWPSLSI